MRSWPSRQDYTFPKRPEEPMCHQCDYDLANWFTISCCLAAHLSGLLAYRAAEARAGRGAALVRPCGLLDERCEPIFAFFLLRSISYLEPPIANRIVSAAGPRRDHLRVRPRSSLPSQASLTAMDNLHRAERVSCGRWRTAASDGMRHGRGSSDFQAAIRAC
jgi:hypothetical protein